jgi:4-amino-4-deoxy-L-arabinose transferase-like glycosyltransferase
LGEFLAGADVQPLPYYGAGRVVTAVLITALLLVYYLLARRLFVSKRSSRGELAALLSVLLLALDPFVLGYSRLMHIAAPLALLMLLTVMAWMLWLREGKMRWALLAGIFGGLALLTSDNPWIGALALADRRACPGTIRQYPVGVVGSSLHWMVWCAGHCRSGILPIVARYVAGPRNSLRINLRQAVG